MMGFGLCNAPTTFSQLMDLVLSGLSWEICLAYLDDVIIFTKNWEEHDQHLAMVLSRLHHAGLKFNPEKCQVARTKVAFLGHVVSGEGVRPDPRLLQAIRDIRTPRSVKGLCSFIGLASYYRRFVKGFAKIADPLHQLLHKKQPWEWTPE